ncbi:bifunctional isocitrate dehydrogenase kinase/phosphatase [Salisaeta longa]|uniref:bifunctional isocitrate dehydrogenase kinase/phosphatase n=1 Tax=Salisaeta longa TaxID=503170 RepID=UPI0003B3BF08|nr:bifunctional isocitrate dehydrogenase kinase/phosphatase [Salisaeta longa]
MPSPADLIANGFAAYQARFRVITQRARHRFEQRDWHGGRHDATARLLLYREVVQAVEADVRRALGSDATCRRRWSSLREAYAARIADRPDAELAETFFNSITRRIFDTVGVDPAIEFVTTTQAAAPEASAAAVVRTFTSRGSDVDLFDRILQAYAHDVPYEDRLRDAQALVRAVRERLPAADGPGPLLRRITLARAIFYRGIGAYLVGRLRTTDDATRPLVIALHHDPHGVTVDAVLLSEDRVSILFSFARSYFRVEAAEPRALIRFLSELLPQKRRAELYISIGYNKHGKTELYRDLLRHFAHATDTFERAPGQPGMVMTVFTMPSYNMVFKVIKDQFDYPKSTTRQAVMERYHVVYKHDRAGRLVDAQEFEHLRLSRRLFSDALLDRLTDEAARTVHCRDGRVILDHCYVERRVTPLDLYLRTAAPADARAAVLDYGQAIKDLARTNIFPGDLLLKNFGVTRHGRVVFYDYDELGFVTDYTFRTKPAPRTHAEEMAAGAWFYVGPADVFPEEFRATMGLSDALMAAFDAHHGDIFTADFWNALKQRLQNNAIIPILPYPSRYRLPHRTV